MIFVVLLALLAASADDLQTVAEKSDFKATAHHAEVVDLCKKIDWSKVAAEYKTADGKPVPDGRTYTLVYFTPTPPRTVQVPFR